MRSRVGRTLAIWSALVALAPLVGGCTMTVRGTSVADGPPIGRAVQWNECRGTGDIPADAQCGVITVPVDYAKPDGAVAHLALIRFPATGQKIGSLVINPGGPGESGVDGAASTVGSLPSDVRERFDLVGFDPRGIGSSKPAVRCNSDADEDAARADPQVDYSPAGIAHVESTEKQYVQRCVDKMGKEFLANVGTASVVEDLDSLRAALGDDELTYLGYSYGTFIGSAYAEAYPDKVRAMILDGAVDPNADSVQSSIDQAAGFQKAFNDFAADCAKKSTCPLGTDPGKAVGAFRRLVDPLVAKGAPTEDPRGLGYSDALTGTIMALYSPDLWKHLTDGLTELSRDHGDTLLVLADVYENRDEQGHYSNSNDANSAIGCVDGPPTTDRAKVIEQDRRVRQVAPFMAYGPFTGRAPLSACTFWPVPPTSTPHQLAIPGLAPTLVVSTTNDPATPYQAGVKLAKELNGGLLTYAGTQHTVVFEGQSCVDDYAAKYLIDLAVPPVGAKC